jgi:hypothetical protein
MDPVEDSEKLPVPDTGVATPPASPKPATEPETEQVSVPDTGFAAPPTSPSQGSEVSDEACSDSDFEPEHKSPKHTRASLRGAPRDLHFCKLQFHVSPVAFYAIACNVAGKNCLTAASMPVQTAEKEWTVYAQLAVPVSVFAKLVGERLSFRLVAEEVTDAKEQAQRLFPPSKCFTEGAVKEKARRPTKRVKRVPEAVAATPATPIQVSEV